MRASFGTLPILSTGGITKSLVRFDLSSIPSSAVIESSTLQLYSAGTLWWGSFVRLHRATAPWDETVTFASFAQKFDPQVVGAFSIEGTGEKSVDLKTQTEHWLAGQDNNGLVIDSNWYQKTWFVSREGGTEAQRPKLTVCYTQPVDHCATAPCENGATCQNGSDGYTCACPAGYEGPRCEVEIDNCADDPCQNGGTCTSDIGGFTCACPTGYSGTLCETNVDECAPAPCQNGGVCEDGVGSYTCHCAPGYEGTDCETVTEHCDPNPCLNGGTCGNQPTGYTCSCPTGYTGDNCEVNVDDCASNPCNNGGTCIDGVNAFTCSCPVDWGGDLCDVNLNSCALQPCMNNGVCTNTVGSYTCECATGYSGAQCEVDINECAAAPCQNGGICVDGVGSYTCECGVGWGGPTCETPVTPTADLEVQFSGPLTAQAGTVVTLTVTVTNKSLTTPVANPRVGIARDRIVLNQATIPGGSCTIGSTLACFPGALPPNTSKTFTVSGISTTTGLATTVATVSSTTTADPVSTNNTARSEVTIVPGVNLALTIGGPAQATGPLTVAYTINVSNLGPANSTGAVVTDTLPALFLLGNATATSTRGSCTVTPVSNRDQVRCDVGALAAGEVATVTVSVNILTALVGSVVNTASVVSANGDTAAANNTASVTTVFSALSGL